MGRIIGYFRAHKVQGWLLTALVGVVLGVVAALLAYPHVVDYMLIRDLGSRNPAVREDAINRAHVAAKRTPRTLRKLNAALDTDDDVQFAAIATALDRAGKFHTAQRDPVLFDRLRAIEFESAADVEVRAQLLSEGIRADRDNRHNRRLLASATRDAAAEVRAASAVLAAKLGDDEALGRLLRDGEPAVAAAAALDAGLAGREGLIQPIAKLLAESQDVEVVSSAAYGLMRLRPEACSRGLAARVEAAAEEPLRERLWHVLTLIADADARRAVSAGLRSARKAGKIPPAMLLVAAARLGIAEARQDVKATLAALGRKPAPLESQLLAALEGARRLRVPVRAEVYRICRDAWGPRWPFLSMAAARELGRQADLPQDADAKAPSRHDCIQLLRDRAVFSEAIELPKPLVESLVPTAVTMAAVCNVFGPQPRYTSMLFIADTLMHLPRKIVTTPVPSAAGAVALWELKTKAAEELKTKAADQYVRAAAGVPGTAPGEYIAWHVSKIRPEEAFKLGMAMLPPLGAAPKLRVYSDTERACGAGLLALSARTAEQKRAAAERIRERLVGKELGGEDDFVVAGAFRCSLLMLGREEFLEAVQSYLGVGDITRRQVVTALCVAGRRDGLDWLLNNPHVPPRLLAVLYLNKGLGEVLAEAAPELPRIDVCGTAGLRLWQAKILQDYYAIRRNTVKVGLGR